MKIKKYDWVKLKTGKLATIVEVLSDTDFLADIGSGPEDWETVTITASDIEKAYGPELKKEKTA